MLDVSLASPTSGTPRQLTNKFNAKVLDIGYPAWAPDGTELVFRGHPQGGVWATELYRIRAAGKGEGGAHHRRVVP